MLIASRSTPGVASISGITILASSSPSTSVTVSPWAASHTSVAMSARGARAPLSRHAHADHLTRATPWPIDIVLGACPRRLLESSSSLQALESTKYTCLDWISRNMVPPRTSKHPGPFAKKTPSIATCCPPVRTVLNVFSTKLIAGASAPAAASAGARPKKSLRGCC